MVRTLETLRIKMVRAAKEAKVAKVAKVAKAAKEGKAAAIEQEIRNLLLTQARLPDLLQEPLPQWSVSWLLQPVFFCSSNAEFENKTASFILELRL